MEEKKGNGRKIFRGLIYLLIVALLVVAAYFFAYKNGIDSKKEAAKATEEAATATVSASQPATAEASASQETVSEDIYADAVFPMGEKETPPDGAVDCYSIKDLQKIWDNGQKNDCMLHNFYIDKIYASDEDDNTNYIVQIRFHDDSKFTGVHIVDKAGLEEGQDFTRGYVVVDSSGGDENYCYLYMLLK